MQDIDVTTVFHGRHTREGIQLQLEAVDSEHRVTLHTFEAVLDDPLLGDYSAARDRRSVLFADNRRVPFGAPPGSPTLLSEMLNFMHIHGTGLWAVSRRWEIIFACVD